MACFFVLCVVLAWPVPRYERAVVVGFEPDRFVVLSSPRGAPAPRNAVVEGEAAGIGGVRFEVEEPLGLLSADEVRERFGSDSRAAALVVSSADVALAHLAGGRAASGELRDAAVRGRFIVGRQRLAAVMLDDLR